MKQKRQPITHQEAISIFYGGVKGLALMLLPFKCKCGGIDYQVKDEDGDICNTAVMTVPDLFKHIRQTHKEFVIKKQKSEKEQLSI